MAACLSDRRTDYEQAGFGAVANCLGWLGPVLVAQMGDAVFPDVSEVVAMRELAQQAEA